MNPSDAEKHEMIDVISDWERLKSENANLRLKLEASERALSEANSWIAIWEYGDPHERENAGKIRSLDSTLKAKDEEIQRLRKCLSKVAGLDCYHYDKILDPELCGDCISCKAREALSPQPMGEKSPNRDGSR
jgi:hypothetical protein